MTGDDVPPAHTDRSRVLIGVIGSDDHVGETISEHALQTAEQVGRLLAENGAILVTGGRGGVMLACSKGAALAGGVVVGILPSLDRSEANAYVTVPLCTGLREIRNHLTITSSDAIIMIAGSTGTLNEATITYGRRPLIVITGTGGWSDRLGTTLYGGAFFDQRNTAEVIFVGSAEEAVEAALSRAGSAPSESLL